MMLYLLYRGPKKHIIKGVNMKANKLTTQWNFLAHEPMHSFEGQLSTHPLLKISNLINFSTHRHKHRTKTLLN